MSRIEERLSRLNGNKALVAFFTAGDPDLFASKEIFSVIEKSGADIIEIGVPFSDPLADGPTIQASSQRSLQNGTTLKKIIELVIKSDIGSTNNKNTAIDKITITSLMILSPISRHVIQ